MKEVYNLVFYRYIENGEEKRAACVFYTDGSIEQLYYSDAVEVAKDIAKTLNIKDNEADKFDSILNKDKVHVVSARELERSFKKFIAPPEVIKAAKKPETIEEVIDKRLDNVELTEAPKQATKKAAPKKTAAKKTTTTKKAPTAKKPTTRKPAAKKDEIDVVPFVLPAEELGSVEVDAAEVEETKAAVAPIVVPASTEKKEEKKPTYKANKKKKEGFMTKVSKSKPVRKLAYGAAALALVFGLGSFAASGLHLNKTDMAGAMNNFGRPAATAPAEAGTQQETTGTVLNETNVQSNDYYDGYTYDQLLQVTNSQIQKDSMIRVHDALYGYNVTFADAHLEEGVDVRAALTFEEVMALYLGYNDFTPQELAAICNGYGFRASDLDNAYKTATLQLMGGYTIESREAPLDMSMLLTTPEAQEFYAKYKTLFDNIVFSEGQAKLDAIDAFYAELYKDFPITDDVREVGISHADGRKQIKSYYNSVLPMVASVEMMTQYLDGYDHTMADKAIAYFNDLGLCNLAGDNFEIAQQVTMGACANEDDTNPRLDQYRDAMVTDLTNLKKYVTDDDHRELSLLTIFKERVNAWVPEVGDWVYDGKTVQTIEQWTETKTWTTTETREEVTRTKKPITDKAKKEVDEQIDKDNAEAKRRAEEAARQEQERLQREADRDAQRIEEEIRQDEQDLQEDINDANDRINQNNSDQDTSNDTPVNEDDFGDHGVDFDDEHSNSNGDLDNSVENITTDPTGYDENEELPDPNVTGREFDAQAPTSSGTQSYDEVEEDRVVETYDVPTEIEIVDDTPVQSHQSEDLPDPSANQDNSKPAQEEHHEEAKPAPQEHHEEAKPAPQEEHHEEAKPAPQEHHEEAKPAPQEHHEESKPSHSDNEAAVNDYVDSLADQVIEDEDVIEYIRRN